MELNKIEGAIEALLFAMGESVELSTLAKTIGHDIETTRKIVRNMMLKYQAEDRGIKIIELENAYQMCTKEEYYDYLVRWLCSRKRLCFPMLCWKLFPSLLINSLLQSWK